MFGFFKRRKSGLNSRKVAKQRLQSVVSVIEPMFRLNFCLECQPILLRLR